MKTKFLLSFFFLTCISLAYSADSPFGLALNKLLKDSDELECVFINAHRPKDQRFRCSDQQGINKLGQFLNIAEYPPAESPDELKDAVFTTPTTLEIHFHKNKKEVGVLYLIGSLCYLTPSDNLWADARFPDAPRGPQTAANLSLIEKRTRQQILDLVGQFGWFQVKD